MYALCLLILICFRASIDLACGFRQDWSHAFYLGKLCQKLGCPSELSLSYYDKAIVINPSAVDAIYRMHASRLKLLYTCRKQNLEDLKVVSHALIWQP